MTRAIQSATAFQRVLDALAAVTGMSPKGSGRQRSSRCPAHHDNSPSLSITDGNDRVLIKCHAQCDLDDILAALQLTRADLFNEPRERGHAHINGTKPAVVAEYPYLDERGQVLFVVERKQPKTFVCKRPDGRGGWIYKGAMEGVRRVLYRLPEVVAAVKAGQLVYVVEGEKDADRLAGLGLVATCNPHGAGPGKWRDDYAQALLGGEAVVVADRDDAGRAHARIVVDSLRRAGVKTHLAEPAYGKDVSEHLDSGRDVVDLITIEGAGDAPTGGDGGGTELTPLVERELQRRRATAEADRIFAVEVAERAKKDLSELPRVMDGGQFLLETDPLPAAMWGEGGDVLWARGEALVIAGPQGVGKTTLAGMLLRATAGLLDKVLGFPVQGCEHRVGYLAMDRPEQARRNLGRMFTEEERPALEEFLRFWTGPPPTDVAAEPETLLRLAQQMDVDVLFVDSLKDAAVGLSKDEVGAGYNRARQLCLAEGIQLVELHHMVKNGADGKAPKQLRDVYGSTWITSGAGSVIVLWGDAGDPIVEFHHLKQPMNEVGPFKIMHDRATGLASVYHDEETDLVALARRCASGGVSARDAATCLYDTEKPSKSQVEKARRKLDDHTEKGLLVRRPPSDGSVVGRGAADLWYPAAPNQWIEGEWTERYR